MLMNDRVRLSGLSAAPKPKEPAMFVCLCTGATRELVAEAVAKGAVTSKQVAAECGAGADCGRCRSTLRAIIAANCQVLTPSAPPPVATASLCRPHPSARRSSHEHQLLAHGHLGLREPVGPGGVG